MDESISTLIEDPWSLSYLPGEWTLIAVPAAVVVLEPAPARASAMVAEVWREVLAAGSASDLTQRLSRLGLDAMPTLAVVFRDDAGLHALLRGPVDLLGDEGEHLGDGRDAERWRGVDIPGPRCRLRLAEARSDLPELPLSMGVVRASEVRFDALPAGRVVESPAEAAHEPEPVTAPDLPASPRAGEPDPGAVAEVLTPGPPMWSEPDQPPSGVQEAAGDWAPEDAEPATLHDGGSQDEERAPAEAPDEDAATVRLVTSSGQVVDVDRPVVIGRAPSADGSDPGSHLLAVPSPSHDISRTHVRVTPGGNGLEVTDLHSTNGTILVAPDGSAIRLAPGRTAPLPVGSIIDLGDGLTIDVVKFRPV